MYSALRDHDPVHHVVPAEKPDHDYWVLSRHADVWEAARDNETFSSALPRCPDFEVDESGIVWAGGSYVRRPLSVPFRVSS
jgi:cytochrome P450